MANQCATDSNPWRLVTWTDGDGRTIRQLACHVDELGDVLNLDFPDGACCRDAVERLTNFAPAKPYRWFRRRWCGFKVGDGFTEQINQGDRPCTVLAVDDHSGHFIYEYEMPCGKVFTRINGRPVNRKRLSRKWRRLLGED